MRDRLVELLKTQHKADYLRKKGITVGNYEEESNEALIADFLLANGVVVPPCKLGDTIYDISEFINCCNSPEMYEDKVSFITIMNRENGEMYFDIECIECDYNDFGNTLFLTKEEAEAKLKGGAK